MEIIILLGLYGSGKTTILNNLKNDELLKLSLDELDKNTRTNNKRINIIFQLFQKFLKINIDFQRFNFDFLDIFNHQNNSLINTLSILYTKYSLNPMNESIKNELRKKILIKSILLFFLIHLDNVNLTKNLIIDTVAMNFLSMDKAFFKGVNKKFEKINLIYLNNSLEQVNYNLFYKNKDHYSFLERGFKKEIY